MHPPAGFTTSLPIRWGRWILIAGLLVSTLLGLVGRMETAHPERSTHLFLDAFSRYFANGRPARNVIVVDVDDISLAAAGQWPWPRYRIAALVDAVAGAKPAAIGLDILFSEPDRTSLKNIRKTYKLDFGLDVDITGASPGLSDNDGYLGSVLARTNAVGARYFYFDHVSKTEVAERPQFQFTGETELLALNDAPGMLDNTYEVASQLKFSGFLNDQPDTDGMLRRVPLLIQHHGVIYPQLALATYMRSIGVSTASIEKDRSGPVIHVGEHFIPVSRSGFALMRLNGEPRLYPAISAIEVLNGSLQPTEVAGKVVFIGSSAAALNDLHSTVFDAQFPGLKSQAVIIDNINSDSFIREPGWGGNAILAACIVLGLLMAALFISLRGPLQLCLGTGALAAVALLLAAGLFHSAGIFLSPGAPMLVVAVLFTCFTTARFAIEKRLAYVWFRKLANAQQVTMESMAAVAETRDPETGAHIKRTQHYVRSIAERLVELGEYTDVLTPEFIDLLFVSAPLHDIGKVGVPDRILLKPGKLTEEEFVLMKKHAEYGLDIIQSAGQKIEGDNFLTIAGEIAFNHHEKWDGTGYPRGLAGQNIPLSGRIMAVADVYDALISRRCYKRPFLHTESFEIMRESRGKIFDPVILDAFFSIESKILEIAARYRDEPERVLGDK